MFTCLFKQKVERENWLMRFTCLFKQRSWERERERVSESERERERERERAQRIKLHTDWLDTYTGCGCPFFDKKTKQSH